MKKIKFNRLALAEMLDAARFYAEISNELGDRFLISVRETLALIKRYPEIGRAEERLRRFTVKHYPFAVIYHIREHEIYIVSIAHTSRRPDYWLDRLSEK